MPSFQTQAFLQGTGIHSGQRASVGFEPGDGIVFVQAGHHGKVCPADWRRVTATQRAITLTGDGLTIQTVEHALAAIGGLGVTGCTILLDGSEIPMMDGSARPFAKVLESFQFPRHPKPSLILRSPIDVPGRNTGTYLKLDPSDHLEIVSRVLIGGKTASEFHYHHSAKHFIDAIAPARTFCLASEWKALRTAGLGKGISPGSGFIVMDDPAALSQIQKDMSIEDLDAYHHPAKPFAILSDEKPRFAEEMARHKILDILGDLALLGCPLQARIESVGTGHTENIAAVTKLAQLL